MAIKIVPINEFGHHAISGWDLVSFERYGRTPFAVLCKRSYRVRIKN